MAPRLLFPRFATDPGTFDADTMAGKMADAVDWRYPVFPLTYSAGGANAPEFTSTPDIGGALVAGMTVSFQANATNTGAMTIKIGSTTKNLYGQSAAALVGYEVISGLRYFAQYDGTQFRLLNPTIARVESLALGDETTNITTGTKLSFRIQCPKRPFNLVSFRGSLGTAQGAGSLLRLDITKNGSTIFTTKPTFNNSSKTTVGATTPAVLTSTPLAFADDDEVVVSVDQVGTAGAKGLKGYLIGFDA